MTRRISATVTTTFGDVTRTLSATVDLPPAETPEEEARGAWQTALPELFDKLRDQERRGVPDIDRHETDGRLQP